MTANDLATLTGRPSNEVAPWLQPLGVAMAEFQINTPAREAAFLAQIVHESDGLRAVQENLAYSASRLPEVWPRHFYLAPDEPDGRLDANLFEHRPEALANVVYACRMGNGPEGSGDGWRYRGRGLIQLTGRSLYGEAGAALQLDLVNQPDALLQPAAAARAAGWYWQHIQGNKLADPATQQAFEQLTVAINGALLGQQHRELLWKQAQSLLGAEA
ncbi:glycoside hydrolase family 19 protein [Hydrogenophaga sp. PBL-H3]|uniref:glycoside hydrolase family 19 protein n=1 Tax=Hydrogenophaga sp. PBL-H3 TaxID=434010 RepID=UPI001320433F|nr:glycoside hydrolase family 19 protein [Hydrogenophaga sp. PBL-H3]QHE76530.1 glycoside hydrolase family 19 protein [Hydrogenophaga sp. PBL-H3]QHE80954.1 glycoside hydrolase family 19 protein [Hydrogenophaga sp. PBL-H3]